MSPRRRRRAPLLLASAAAAVALVGVAGATAGATPLQASPAGLGPAPGAGTPESARTGRDPTVDLTVTRLEPVTVTPDRLLRISGQVRALARPALQKTTVALQVSNTPITARSSIDDVLADPGPLVPVPGGEVTVGAVKPGRPGAYRLRIDPATLPLSVTGVYPMRLVVTANVDGSSVEVAEQTTLLPWYPAADQVARTRMLFVWPLIDVPHRDGTGAFTDDGLASSIRPGGRLDTLVAAGADRPVTWFVDPALLADTSAMSAGYQIRASQAGTGTAEAPVKGTSSDEAQRWLEAFNLASSRHEVNVVPYGDVDVTGTVDAGRLSLARSAGRWGAALAQQILGRPVRSDVAWPDQGEAAQTTVDRLPSIGDGSVILSGDQVPPDEVLAYTPSGRAVLGPNDVQGLLTDPTLQSLVATHNTADPVLARQRFLGETLLITAELPTASRLVVVTPPRRWNPSRAYADALIQAFTQARWLKPVSLDRALRWPVPTLARAALPTTPPADQLPASYVDLAAASYGRLQTFGAILTEPRPIVGDYRAALYSSLSTSYRRNVDVGLQALTQTSDALERDRAKVRIVSRGGTLTSNSGTFPLTVVNDLDQEVRLGLDVESADPLRLQISAPESIDVRSGERVSVSAKVDATTSGDLAASAQLVTPRNRVPYSAPVDLEVRVRAYGQVALLVFGGAAAVLVLAAAIRVFRRIRTAREGASS